MSGLLSFLKPDGSIKAASRDNPVPTADQPGTSLREVTPDNSEDLPDGPCRALWVGIQGDVRVIAEEDDAAVTLVGVQGILPISVKRVLETATTASSIRAIY